MESVAPEMTSSQRADSLVDDERVILRERHRKFAEEHRASAGLTSAMVGALARRIAVAASCLAVGDASAMLRPHAWSRDVHFYQKHGATVKLRGTELLQARARWRLWYRLLTAGHYLRFGDGRPIVPLSPFHVCALAARLYQGASVDACEGNSLPECDQLLGEIVRSILLGVAVAAWGDLCKEGVVACNTESSEDGRPMLGWVAFSAEYTDTGRCYRIERDLSSLLVMVRRFDGSGSRARELAYAYTRTNRS